MKGVQSRTAEIGLAMTIIKKLNGFPSAYRVDSCILFEDTINFDSSVDFHGIICGFFNATC